MEELQGGGEVVDRGVARHDDGQPPAGHLLQRRQDERARLDGCAGQLDAGGRDETPEGLAPCDERAERGDEVVVAVHEVRAARDSIPERGEREAASGERGG